MPSRIDDKLKAQGFDPEEIKSSLRNYIGEGRAFASPQEYATAVKEKRDAGTLQDPHAARAFEQIAPSLFGGPKTEFHFGEAQTPELPGIDPRAQDLLSAVSGYQQEHPISIPVAPGTPTRWQVQDEHAMEQDRIADEWARKEWERDEDRYRREWDYMVEQDRIANELARARTHGGVGATPDYGDPGLWDVPTGGFIEEVNRRLEGNDLIRTEDERRAFANSVAEELVRSDIAEGESFEGIVGSIRELAHEMQALGVDPNQVIRYATEQFETFYDETTPAWHPTHDADWRERRRAFEGQRDEVLGDTEEPRDSFMEAFGVPKEVREYLFDSAGFNEGYAELDKFLHAMAKAGYSTQEIIEEFNRRWPS